jgi:hypothetical protein
MTDSHKTEHISESIMERFSVRDLPQTELGNVANHLADCPNCQAAFVSFLQRQREGRGLSFTIAPEFWSRHEHLDYEQLVDLAHNKVETTDRELIDLHLNVCPTCKEDLRSFMAFREQITPEMSVPYTPQAQKLVRKGVFSVRWWQSLVWKPLYSAALILIGLAFVIGLALLLNRRAGNQQVRHAPTPQMNSSGTPDFAASPSLSGSPNELPIEKPNGLEATVALNDRIRKITVDKAGNVTGLDDVSEPTRDEIVKVLVSGKLDRPSILKELGNGDSALRGKSSQPFKLIFPSRTVIVSDRPALRWEKAPGARSYRIYINDSTGHEVSKSEELSSEQSEWALPMSLKRGEIYTWTVVALVDGKEVISPGPSAPEMKFRVLSASDVQRLNQLKKTDSHLVLGVFYARAGMILDAEREFQAFAKNNPRSPLAKTFLKEIQSWISR